MKYKNSKVLLIGIIMFAFFCIYIPNSAYSELETPRMSNTYVPDGLIAMWSGTIESIPAGWILCDGTQFTPNTTDRFIYGTDGVEDAGTTGGDDSHNHGYSNVPLHDHGISGVTDCSHHHGCDSYSGTVTVGPEVGATVISNKGVTDTGSSSASHSHSTTTTGIATCYTEPIDDIFPPYYEIAFIKKISNDPIIPAGVILIWNGTSNDIPQGWAECNGSYNTPDLESQFIKGVADTNPGTIGGNLTHSHVYTELPQHSHSLATSGASHSHTAQCSTYRSDYLWLFWVDFAEVTSGYTDYASVPHVHSMSPFGQVVCSTEESSHLPPYKTVTFIMNTQQTIGVPTGSICLWSDTVVNIPFGWDQCDGSGDTLDFREVFLRGSSLLEPSGTIDGYPSHSHMYTEVPMHNHNVISNDMLHRHSLAVYSRSWQAVGGSQTVFGPGVSSTYTSMASATHSHDILPAGIPNPETEIESNNPPYIELTFIQQVSPLTSIGWVTPAVDANLLFSRSATVQFDFEYSWLGLGNDVTLSFTNGTDIHDAGSVLSLDHIFMPYLDGEVDATFHLMQDATELTSATRSFTFYNNRDPSVTLVNPNGGEIIEGTYEITWSGSDPDGDQLYYTIEYDISNTGWVEIASSLTGTSYNWDTELVPDSESVELRVIARDAFGGESIDESDAAFEIDNKGIPGFNLWILIPLLGITSLLIARKIKK